MKINFDEPTLEITKFLVTDILAASDESSYENSEDPTPMPEFDVDFGEET